MKLKIIIDQKTSIYENTESKKMPNKSPHTLKMNPGFRNIPRQTLQLRPSIPLPSTPSSTRNPKSKSHSALTFHKISKLVTYGI